MKVTPQAYAKMAKEAEPRSKAATNTAVAYLVGGGICALGQVLRQLFMGKGFTEEHAALWTSVILIAASAFLTGMGWYSKLGKHAGAGTLVPITGFANSISSSAVEARSEGYISGIGTKIFTIAGPVILYGTTAAMIYGIIYYILS